MCGIIATSVLYIITTKQQPCTTPKVTMGRFPLEYIRFYTEKNNTDISSKKTPADKWQSSRALILLVHYLCSSTLSIQKPQKHDYYNTCSRIPWEFNTASRGIKKKDAVHPSLSQSLPSIFLSFYFYDQSPAKKKRLFSPIFLSTQE